MPSVDERPSAHKDIREEGNQSSRTKELFERHARCDDPVEARRLLDEIVLLNLNVADALASRYVARGFPTEDLVQVARLALVRVVQAFRLDFERDFLAYAVPSIRGELRKYFRDVGWTVRPPRRIQEAQLLMKAERPQLVQELGREPTVKEMAEVLQLDEETVIEVLAVDGCYSPDSLDRPMQSDDGAHLTLGERLGTEDPGFAATEACVILEPLLRQITPRDRKVLHLRFVEGLTQSEIGEQIGVTQMQVSRILSRILTQLRKVIVEEPSGRTRPRRAA